MDVNGHERLFNITLRHRFKYRNRAFIAVLHFTVTMYVHLMEHSVVLILGLIQYSAWQPEPVMQFKWSTLNLLF
jgi:hypothetical protein